MLIYSDLNVVLYIYAYILMHACDIKCKHVIFIKFQFVNSEDQQIGCTCKPT